MKAFVFHGVGDARLEDIPVPKPAYGEAVLRSISARFVPPTSRF